MNLNKTQAKQIAVKLKEKFIEVKFLAKGNHNSNFLLQTEKQKFIIRIENNLQFKNLKKEYNFLKMAPLGLGPRVYVFDNSQKIIPYNYFVEEFIEGKHPSEKNPSDHFIVAMAKWLKKLHSIKKSTTRPYLLSSQVKPFYQNYLKYKSHLPAKIQKSTERLLSDGLNFLRQNNKIFATRKKLSLLHNDISAENILIQSKSIKLIDWEFVGFGLPEREIAYFFDSYNLSKKQEELFLKSYGFSQNSQKLIRLNLIYVILLFSSIGYSLWQLDILEKQKAGTKEKSERMKRLLRDLKLLKVKINS